jgi:hypothetical protein
MALDTTRLFQNYVDKDRDAVTLLVAQSLLALALESDPVTKLTQQYREGISAPSVDFFCYPSTRLTASGDTVLPSPFKPGAKILVKHLAYMDEAHVSHLLVIRKEHLHEPLPDYGYDITTTTLSIVFDPKRTYIPTAIYMRWPSAVNVPTTRVGNTPVAIWPHSIREEPMGEAHEVYEEESWERHH